MIESRELMIGNWVKHNDLISGSEYPGTVFQWSTAHWYDIETCGLSFGSIEGIPLTGEVLSEWCGFDKINHVDEYAFYYLTGIKNPRIAIYPHAKRTEFMGWDIAHCEFLHQLQNLIHAVTGNELKVKIP